MSLLKTSKWLEVNEAGRGDARARLGAHLRGVWDLSFTLSKTETDRRVLCEGGT